MMTVSADSVSMICLDWAACSSSLTLLLFSLFEITMRMSLLCTKQWAVWSCHLQLLQHSLKCSDVWWHFKKSVIPHVWQLIQSAEINTLWLWIRIALMYNSWWVLIWFSVTHCCMNKMFTLSSAKMTIVDSFNISYISWKHLNLLLFLFFLLYEIWKEHNWHHNMIELIFSRCFSVSYDSFYEFNHKKDSVCIQYNLILLHSW